MLLYMFLAFKADESPDARFQTAKPKFSEIMKENLNTGSNNKSGATSAASNIAKGLKLSVDDGHLKVEIKTSSKDKDLIKGKLDTLKGKFDELLKSNKLAKEAGKVNLNEEGEFSIITYETDVEGVGNTSEESGGSASAESSVDTNIGGDDAMDTGASSMAKAFAK